MLLYRLVFLLLCSLPADSFSTINFNLLKQTTLRLQAGPFKPIEEPLLRMNKFGLGLGVKYKKTEERSQKRCGEVCRDLQTCSVAVHCPNNPYTPTEIGRCHILERSPENQPIPAESVTDSCSYLTVNPKCRKTPSVSNAKPEPKFTFLNDGTIKYTYTCSPGFDSKGVSTTSCSKTGIWTQPSLMCTQQKIVFKSKTPENLVIKKKTEGSNPMKKIISPSKTIGLQSLKTPVLSNVNTNPFVLLGNDNAKKRDEKNGSPGEDSKDRVRSGGAKGRDSGLGSVDSDDGDDSDGEVGSGGGNGAVGSDDGGGSDGKVGGNGAVSNDVRGGADGNVGSDVGNRAVGNADRRGSDGKVGSDGGKGVVGNDDRVGSDGGNGAVGKDDRGGNDDDVGSNADIGSGGDVGSDDEGEGADGGETNNEDDNDRGSGHDHLGNGKISDISNDDENDIDGDSSNESSREDDDGSLSDSGFDDEKDDGVGVPGSGGGNLDVDGADDYAMPEGSGSYSSDGGHLKIHPQKTNERDGHRKQKRKNGGRRHRNRRHGRKNSGLDAEDDSAGMDYGNGSRRRRHGHHRHGRRGRRGGVDDYGESGDYGDDDYGGDDYGDDGDYVGSRGEHHGRGRHGHRRHGRRGRGTHTDDYGDYGDDYGDDDYGDGYGDDYGGGRHRRHGHRRHGRGGWGSMNNDYGDDEYGGDDYEGGRGHGRRHGRGRHGRGGRGNSDDYAGLDNLLDRFLQAYPDM